MRVVQSEHRRGITGGIEPHRKVGKKRPGCGPKELQPATVKCKTAKWLVPSTPLHPPHALLLPFWPKPSPVCMNRPPPPTQSKLYSGAAETSKHTPKTGRQTCMAVSMPVPRAPKARGNLSPRGKNTPRHQTYTYSRNGRHSPWRHFISVCMCNLMSILEEGERKQGKDRERRRKQPSQLTARQGRVTQTAVFVSPQPWGKGAHRLPQDTVDTDNWVQGESNMSRRWKLEERPQNGK